LLGAVPTGCPFLEVNSMCFYWQCGGILPAFPPGKPVENPSGGFLVKSPLGFREYQKHKQPKPSPYNKNARSVFTKKPPEGFSTGFLWGLRGGGFEGGRGA